MDYKIIDLGGLKKQLEVTATVEDVPVKEKLETAYSEFQKNAAIPGFRKGKTPIEIVRKRYGDEIESESIPDIVNEIVKGIFEKENTKIAGVVDYNLDSRKSGEPLHFRLTYEVVPEIEPKDYKGMALERAMYRILPETVDHELLHIREANSELQEVNSLEDEKAMATVDLQVIDEKGLPLIGQRRENYKIDIRSKAPELSEIRERLLKGKIGDEFNIELETFGKNGQQSGKKPFKVYVKKMEKYVMPEPTDCWSWNDSKRRGWFDICEHRQESRRRRRRNIFCDSHNGHCDYVCDYAAPEMVNLKSGKESPIREGNGKVTSNRACFWSYEKR